MKRSNNPKREILFELSDVARALRTYVDQRAREHGTTRAQWGVLARLERAEGMMQAELAEVLEMQPISLARLIDRLCGQELVERRPHPTDRRANCLYITGKGRLTLAHLGPLGREIAGDVLSSFTEEELTELLDKLLLIKGNLRKATVRRSALVTSGEDRHAR
jgi:DNA-binding MarR family transcriptional regulator